MLKVFAVRDVKGDAYGSLMCLQTRGLAMRAFIDACSDSRSPLAQYPEDFQLYELADYDPVSGAVIGHKVPSFVASAVEAIAASKKCETTKVEVAS